MELLDALGEDRAQLWVTAVVVVLWFSVGRIGRLVLKRGADASGLLRRQADTVVRTVRIVVGVVGLSALAFVWGIDIEGVLLLATSVVTLTGVALFAQWSLLSNVTAYAVLLMQPSFRRGNFVRILEVDNYVEGTVADIGPFHTRLITEERSTLLIPNTTLLSRTVIVNPRDRLNVAGKLPPMVAEDDDAPVEGGRPPAA